MRFPIDVQYYNHGVWRITYRLRDIFAYKA